MGWSLIQGPSMSRDWDLGLCECNSESDRAGHTHSGSPLGKRLPILSQLPDILGFHRLFDCALSLIAILPLVVLVFVDFELM